jgi:DNA invertase Pin-like site-specific DNA recombinase
MTFRSLTEGITTTGPNGKAMLTILTALTRLERDTTTERTQAGMAFAAAHGRQVDDPAVTAANAAVKRTHELKARGLKPAEIGKMTGLSRATIYRYLNIGSDERA